MYVLNITYTKKKMKIIKVGSNNMGLIFGFLGFLVLDCLVLSMAANVHHYTFVLKEDNFTRLCSTKKMLTVNGSFPGPAIRVRKGDTAFVNVVNAGLYGVTIHWHGVKQPRNPWSDGPENITQCPIAPGSNFTYEVIFSTEEGTLWWHAHSGWARATVHGAIVIEPAIGTTYPFPKPYKQEIFVIGSWYKGDPVAIGNAIVENGTNPVLSDSCLINGQPGDLLPCSNQSTFRMPVKTGKTYLLRIVNAGMNEENYLGVANHTMTVVATDAAYIKPITTDYIMITPGQTMDVLLTADQPPSHYYMAASTFADSVAPSDDTTATAVIVYDGNYTAPATPSLPALPAFNDTAPATNFTARLRSLATEGYPVNVPARISKRMYIVVSINRLPCEADQTCPGANNTKNAASLNNISFAIPSTDILQAYYRRLPGVFMQGFPNKPPRVYNFTGTVGDNVTIPKVGTTAKVFNYGDTVEMVFQGTNIPAAENHPIHLHGYSFYLVGTGFGNFNKTSDPKTYNLVDPPEVNTFGLPKNGWAAIRFVANNPGVWFMHCHLERHATWGMDGVLIVKNGKKQSEKIRPPPPNMPPCM